MSLITSAAAASAPTSLISLPTLGHRKSLHASAVTAGSSTPGSSSSAPSATSLQGLFSTLLKSIEQVVGLPAVSPSVGAVQGASSPAAATAPATATAPAATTAPATPSSAQPLQSFVHTLFQALKADGLRAPPGAAATGAGGAAGTGNAATAQAYSGSLAASLQTLIQQLGSTATPTGATASLSASFNNLLAASGGGAVAPSAGANANASLQSFLSNLLQNVQHDGTRTLSGLGGSVNASV